VSEVRDQDSALGFTDPIAALRAALKGRYEIERQIGQGAFATVYLARDLKHERKVAIKVLNADPESETGEIRFIREIRVVARLQHPNILPLHDSGHVEALLYYVMPYVTGETLRIRMHRERQMGVEAACAIARETADALAYAHSQGIVHRDIKPENILLSGGHAIVADFGIARAIDVGGVRQLTMTGVAGPGTPAYMSPEQLLGDRAVDARSDIYSLGCVLYEMLAGKPPFPGKDGFVKRFTEPPPHISSLRRDAPPWVNDVVAKALAKDPDDRYRTAGDFVAALTKPVATVRAPKRETFLRNALASPPLFESDPLEAEELSVAFPRSYPSPGLGGVSAPARNLPNARKKRWLDVIRGHPVALGISILLTLAITALAASGRISALPDLFRSTAEADSDRYVVLASGGSADKLSDVGSQVADSIYDALTKWNGLPVVPETRIAQAIADGNQPPRTEAEALALGRRLGAGRVIWVHSSGTPRAPRVRVHLYDVSTSQSVDEFGVPSSPRGEAFYESATKRLLAPNRSPAATSCDGSTRSFAAWSACNRAHTAFDNWDVRAALHAFGAAVNADADYAPARLWLAQLLLWTRPETEEWRAHGIRAARSLSALSPRDSALASAVAALASGDFLSACATYSRLTDVEPRSFVGWFGLGECHRLDQLVVPDRRSKSGWSFRSSLHTARRMFDRALVLEPHAHALLTYDEVEELLPITASTSRVGYTSDSSTYAAFPSLENDTLAFVPYPVSQFSVLPLSERLTHNAALERNSERLLSFATAWTAQFPQSPDAFEALSHILEARGEVTDSRSPDRSALGAVLRASRLATSSAQRLRLSTREVRLRLKRGEFTRASAIADSLLGNQAVAGEEDAREMIAVAALTGKIAKTALLARQGGLPLSATSVSIPPPVSGAAADLFAHAALGSCGPEGANLLALLERQLQSYVPETHRAEVRGVLRTRSLSMMTPCDRGKSALQIGESHDRLHRMQRAFARNDFTGVRRTIDSLSQMRRSSRPGHLSMDYTYQEAWLKAEMGDVSAAIEQLDLALGAMPALSGNSLKDAGVAAAVGRAMILRADLAKGQNDLRTAGHWARAVAALWDKADKPLQPTVQRMRLLGADQ
jgi:serine/threonine protein kinase